MPNCLRPSGDDSTNRRDDILHNTGVRPLRLATPLNTDFGKDKRQFSDIGHPIPRLRTVRFSWSTPANIDAQLASYGPVPADHSPIWLWDYEARPCRITSLATLRKVVEYVVPLCRKARDAGYSPGVCSMAPWTRLHTPNSSVNLADANALFANELFPHIDWLSWEWYCPFAEPSKAGWFDAARDTGLCVMALMHPYNFRLNNKPARWSTPEQWRASLEIARDKADLTCLWQDQGDVYGYPPRANPSLAAYHTEAVNVFTA